MNDNDFYMSAEEVARYKGNVGEDFACEVLISKGHTILCRNYTCRGGEIDIISKIGKYIVFTEVKMRSGTWSPMASVTRKKIETVKKCALAFLAEKGMPDGVGPDGTMSVRIDIIALRQQSDGISLLSHIEGLNLLPNTAKRF